MPSVVCYPGPDPGADAGDFEASASATLVHDRVRLALDGIDSSAGIASANRSIAQYFAGGSLHPEAGPAARIGALAHRLQGVTFADMEAVENAIRTAVDDMDESDRNLEDYARAAEGATSMLDVDLGEASMLSTALTWRSRCAG